MWYYRQRCLIPGRLRCTLFAGATLLIASACGSTASPGDGVGVGGAGATGGIGAAGGGGGATAASGGATADCAHIDYAAYASVPAVSLRNDVLPIFGLSCTLSDCHRPLSKRAGLILGYRCAPDPSSKWKCTFPATPGFVDGSTTDIDELKPQPLDAATVAMVRTSLLAPAQTVNGGAVARVVPFHPEKSFLVQKLADTESAQGYSCTNQDPTNEDPAPGSTMPPPCGVFMPLRGDLFCQGTTRPRFDAVAAWIAQGALGD